MIHSLIYWIMPITLSAIFLASCAAGSKRSAASLNFANEEWKKVDEALAASVQAGTYTNILFEIYNSKHEKVYQYMAGNFDPSREVSILSASKWISSATIMVLVDKKKLKLDDPIGKYIRNRDGKKLKKSLSQITLRQLLSMSSGLFEDHPCYGDYNITLKECVHQILETKQEQPVTKPGQDFKYGDAHLSVAAYLAEVATGQDWQDIFNENMRKPLGLISEAEFFAKPKSLKGAMNPRPAAGLRITYDDYLKFMQMIMNRGSYGGQQVLSQKSIREMETSQLAKNISLTKSSYKELDLHASYGLGVWIECKDEACRKFSVASPGFYGFYPWLDRNLGYYAVLGAMEEKPVFSESIQLENRLKPLIEAAFVRGSP